LNTGVVSFVASGHNASIESVGNGWYRCILSTTNSATWDFFQFGLSNASNSATSPSGGNAYIWGAQANIGSTAKPYFPTTDRLNVPRLTYQNGGGGCPSLLLEKQSTNLLTYSEQFDNAGWTKSNTSITANQAISPDGTQSADKSTIDTSTTYHDSGIQSFTTTIGQVYTFTLFAKKGTGIEAFYYYSPDGGLAAKFNLNNGAYIGHAPSDGYSAFTSYGSENLGNGWYRFYATYTATLTSGTMVIGISTNTNNSITPIAGNGTDFLYLWGAQAELSSYPTSYIPTTSASATRVADDSFKTGISSLIGQTEGVLFVDVELKAYDSLAKWIAFLGGGSYYIGFYTDGNSRFVAEVYDNNSSFLNQSFTFSVGQRYKLALAYKANDFAFYVNGTQVATDNSGTVPATSDFSFEYNSTAAQLTSRIYNQAVLFKTRLSNSDLQALTTI
jgi:hypothetical protein